MKKLWLLLPILMGDPQQRIWQSEQQNAIFQQQLQQQQLDQLQQQENFRWLRHQQQQELREYHEHMRDEDDEK